MNTQLISGTLSSWFGVPSNLNSTITDRMKEAATAAMVVYPASFGLSLNIGLRIKDTTAKDRSGKRNINQTKLFCISLPFHQIDFIRVNRFFIPVDRYYYCQSYGSLSSRDCHRKQRKNLTGQCRWDDVS
jgi:hypothetical protein